MDLRRQFFVLGSKLQGFKLETFIIVIFSASDPDPLQETWIRFRIAKPIVVANKNKQKI